MKSLIVFYSRTGTTKKIAQEIAKKINADLDELIDLKNRKGFLNWIIAGKEGMKKSLTKIKYSKDPKKYDLVVIGTPIWVSITPAARSYLSNNKFKRVAFFSTSGGENLGKTFQEMERLSKKPIAVFSLRTKEVNQNLYMTKLNEFCNKLK
jgi:flavodoxin